MAVAPRSFRLFLSFVGAACCAVASNRAVLAAEPSKADALYKTALEQMRAGQYEAACPMLDKSYQLDPLPGTLFAAGECESARGKVATAIDRYQSFVDALGALPADKRAKFDERQRLALERIARLRPPAPSEATSSSIAGAPAAARPSAARVLAYVSLGVGVGGMVAGLVSGAIAVEKKSTIDDNCPGSLCNATGRVAVEEAKASANVSTIGVTVGLAGLTTAVILWMVSSPSSKRTDAASVALRPRVIGSNQEASIGLEGAF